jgi:hypothetical protein
VCWECDHPNGTRLDYLAHIRGVVGRYGWAIQAVEREGARPPWAYTVGLSAAGLPELVVTGMRAVPAAELLNDLAAHAVHCGDFDSDFAPGARIPLVGGPLVEVVEVEVSYAHLDIAVDLYGRGVRGRQLVHADERGRWPWEPGYRGIRGGQPVLGRRQPVVQ